MQGTPGCFSAMMITDTKSNYGRVEVSAPSTHIVTRCFVGNNWTNRNDRGKTNRGAMRETFVPIQSVG